MCRQALAALPFYLEDASLNIYSLEELSYYIENNLYFLGKEFMSEELCGWLEKELGLKDTAEKLRDICRQNGTLFEFVMCILQESGYCPKEKILQIAKSLQEMEHKSEYECGKIRADRYMENQKYVSAIYEYRKLLTMKEEKNPILVGNVWHNMGCAYAKLFLFEEAVACYKKAYAQNQNPESLRESLFSYRCMQDETGFEQTVEEYGVSEEEVSKIRRRIQETCESEEIREFEQKTDALFLEENEAKINAQIAAWKDIYRKNCRI